LLDKILNVNIDNNYDNIPAILKEKNNWLLEYGNKHPYSYKNKSWNKGLLSFNEAYEEFTTKKIRSEKHFPKEKYIGLGYYLNNDFLVIDFDKCCGKKYTLYPEILEVLTKLDQVAYIEWSYSGKGIHIFTLLHQDAKAIKIAPFQLNSLEKYKNLPDECKVEFYSSKKAFLLTGNLFNNSKNIACKSSNSTIQSLYNSILEVKNIDTNKNSIPKDRIKSTSNSEDVFQEVKNKVQIYQVLNYYEIPTKRKGSNDFILCLWHDEKDPDCQINYDTNNLYCHVCAKAFSTIDVVMIKENINNLDATKKLNEIFKLNIEFRKVITLDRKHEPEVEKNIDEHLTSNRIKRVYNIFLNKLLEEIIYLEYKLKKLTDSESKELKLLEDKTTSISVEIDKKKNIIDKLNIELIEGKAINYFNRMLSIKNTEEKTKYFKSLTLVFFELYIDNNKINPYYLSEIISLYFPMFYWGKTLFIYEKGVYKFSEITVFEKVIMFILEKHSRINIKNEIIDKIQSINHIEATKFNEEVDNKPNYFNFKNGLLVFDEDFLETGNRNYKFMNHTPEYKSILQIAYKFDDTLTINEIIVRTPMFQKFLTTSFNDGKERQLAIEKIAYTFFNSRVKQEITYVCGEGGNGKGVYQRILSKLHTSSLSNPDIIELTDPEKRNNFFSYKLLFSPAIFSSEAKKVIKDTSLLKRISGDDMIDIEQKYLSHQIKMKINSKIFVSTNHDIKFLEWSKADERRAEFLEMNNSIDEDPELEQRIEKEEMKYIAMYIVIKGLFPLITRKFKKFTLPDSHFKLFKKYQEYNNNILCFINNHITPDNNGAILKNDIFYLINKEFTNQYRNKKNLFDKFELELKKQNINFTTGKTRCKSFETGNEKEGVWCYKGITHEEVKEIGPEMEYIKNERQSIEGDFYIYNNMTKDELLKKLEYFKNGIDTIEKILGKK